VKNRFSVTEANAAMYRLKDEIYTELADLLEVALKKEEEAISCLGDG